MSDICDNADETIAIFDRARMRRIELAARQATPT